MLGVYGVMDMFPIGVIMNKGLTVRTAQQNGQKYLPRLLEHASKGELDPSYLVTHRFSLEPGDAALRPYFDTLEVAIDHWIEHAKLAA